ncbi:hypothetical protein [Amycolatopsis pigmentata]|uniref:Serine/threonine protein kinase n=1 Tax=Amycolatopsis pigmentata TaxID=450801 RepID=A0ABW5FX63_9PSEU
MNDDVSVARLSEPEGHHDAPSSAASRFRLVAVMLAVVLGCGLAAILVHLASTQQRADDQGQSVFDVPHGPTGGLAGGGVPSSMDETEVTDTSTKVTVTNAAPPTGSNGLPWATRRHPTSTVTVTQSSQPSATGSTSRQPGNPRSGNNGGGNNGGNSTSKTPPPDNNTTTTSPPNLCLLGILFC